LLQDDRQIGVAAEQAFNEAGQHEVDLSFGVHPASGAAVQSGDVELVVTEVDGSGSVTKSYVFRCGKE